MLSAKALAGSAAAMKRRERRSEGRLRKNLMVIEVPGFQGEDMVNEDFKPLWEWMIRLAEGTDLLWNECVLKERRLN